MNKPAGCTFVLDDEVKEKVPLQYKLAANELAKQFHKVLVTSWGDDELDLAIYRDEDTLNPTYYKLVRRGSVFYRQESHGQHALWPVYKTTEEHVPPVPKSALRRSTVSRLKAQRARERDNNVYPKNDYLSIQSAFVDRTEIMEDIRDADIEFMREPTFPNAMKLKELRERLAEAEMRIVALKIAEQATKDLS